MMHAEFDALAQGKCDYTLKVIPIANDGETLMTILATEEAVYISKAQAMAFFGLVEPAQLAAPVAAESGCLGCGYPVVMHNGLTCPAPQKPVHAPVAVPHYAYCRHCKDGTEPCNNGCNTLAAPVAAQGERQPAEVEAGNRGLASLEAAMQGERQPGICPACKEHTLSYGHCIYCGHSCAVSA